ncbi:alpha/beta hydrolase [Bacteroides caecigallinarum]|uniref:alpha/beta hydrolase n=1 Tax=Bacteroides caecigallinarum TaxID=1411144 RepID=UPI001F33BCAC|nr:alpha/beta hydrolase [Bacteroides caecigallinarum]
MKNRIVISVFLVLFSLSAVCQENFIRIWEGTGVGSKKVTLQLFLPEKNLYSGMAVIVCPGGSYCWHDYEVEGVDVARWLQNEGIAAFVLKYRVQGVFNFIFHTRAVWVGHKHPDMLEDIQRSIQLIRENASQYNINPHRLGVMGFSAGGHLVMSSACYYETDFLSKIGIKHSTSLRPDFVASIYPVVSMSHSVTHKRSRRALLGEWKQFSQRMRDSLSLELHIPPNCPPVFLVNCKDDPIVNYYNSVLLDSALTSNGVNHKYIQYQTGGHGFGASDIRGTAECRKWRNDFFDWLIDLYN